MFGDRDTSISYSGAKSEPKTLPSRFYWKKRLFQQLTGKPATMEDSFRVRVDKTFGSLASSSNETASLRALWSLTDDELERKEWSRDMYDGPAAEERDKSPRFTEEEEEEEKRPKRFREEMEKDLNDLDEDDGDEMEEAERRSSRGEKPEDCNDEEWEIRSSIGMDSTLDREEEEDEYDKVAVGAEKSGERLYMKDAKDYETEADDWDALPNSFNDVARDPRANHMAAKMRLKEDAEAAKKLDCLCVSEKIECLQVSESNISLQVSESPDSLRGSANEANVGMDGQVNSSENVSLKSILKRKDEQVDPKSQKRVRISSECMDGSNKGSGEVNKDAMMETSSAEEGNVSNDKYELPPDYPSGIPDYMRNPSKYTRYTFDSGVMDEESNKQAYMDFINMLKSRRNGAESVSDDTPIELPKSVAFVPKRKPSDAAMLENGAEPRPDENDVGKEITRKRGMPVIIAAADSRDDEVCPMEEDEMEMDTGKRSSSGRTVRQYRAKAKEDHVD